MKRGVNPQKEKKIYFFKLYKRNEIIWFSLANEIAEARDLFSTHTQSVEVQQVKLTNHEWKFKDRISIEIHELNTHSTKAVDKNNRIVNKNL
jgi:hypothetical protein